MVALFDKYVLRTLALIVAFVLFSASAAAQKNITLIRQSLKRI